MILLAACGGNGNDEYPTEETTEPIEPITDQTTESSPGNAEPIEPITDQTTESSPGDTGGSDSDTVVIETTPELLQELGDLIQEYKEVYQDTNGQSFTLFFSNPAKGDFDNQASYQNPGNFTFNEIKSKDPRELSWAMFFVTDQIQSLRDEWSQPVIINSGYRNPKHNLLNLSPPGASNSQHMYGTAVDMKTIDMDGDGDIDTNDARQMTLDATDKGAAFVSTPDSYPTHVHADWRTVRPCSNTFLAVAGECN
ncbi:MAG: DUF882 domain-containing protein [SAR324 cluster bacterium]|nr:DUF882 domain-containing protein [SAR324 cluster bacterium]